MKRLSDYTGEEAIEIWADIIDPAMVIIEDEEVQKYTTGKGISIKDAVKVILKKYRKEAMEILNRINDKPLNGASSFPALTVFVSELVFGDNVKAFSRSSEQEKPEDESSGSATGNIKDGEK